MSISAYISTYRRNEILISRSLASVLRQTLPPDEIHIVADGMEGKELEDLEIRLIALEDERITLWNIKRQVYPRDPGRKWCVLGLKARNFAMDRCTGDWIAPLDDDDEWTDDHLEVLLHAAIRNEADVAYGISDYKWFDGHPQQAGRWPPGMGAFCDGAHLMRNGLGYRYDPACLIRGLPMDGDLWERMYKAGVKFTFIPKVVHKYWVNPR